LKLACDPTAAILLVRAAQDTGYVKIKEKKHSTTAKHEGISMGILNTFDQIRLTRVNQLFDSIQ